MFVLSCFVFPFQRIPLRVSPGTCRLLLLTWIATGTRRTVVPPCLSYLVLSFHYRGFPWESVQEHAVCYYWHGPRRVHGGQLCLHVCLILFCLSITEDSLESQSRNMPFATIDMDRDGYTEGSCASMFVLSGFVFPLQRIPWRVSPPCLSYLVLPFHYRGFPGQSVRHVCLILLCHSISEDSLESQTRNMPFATIDMDRDGYTEDSCASMFVLSGVVFPLQRIPWRVSPPCLSYLVLSFLYRGFPGESVRHVCLIWFCLSISEDSLESQSAMFVLSGFVFRLQKILLPVSPPCLSYLVLSFHYRGFPGESVQEHAVRYYWHGPPRVNGGQLCLHVYLVLSFHFRGFSCQSVRHVCLILFCLSISEDSLESQSRNMPFATIDMDRDGYTEGSCASMFGGGGWWYRRCLEANLNGQWRTHPTNYQGSAADMVWFHFRGWLGLKESTMMIRCKPKRGHHGGPM